MAGSIVRSKLVTLEEVVEDRMLAKLLAVMDNVSDSGQAEELQLHQQTLSTCCLKERHWKSCQPGATRQKQILVCTPLMDWMKHHICLLLYTTRVVQQILAERESQDGRHWMYDTKRQMWFFACWSKRCLLKTPSVTRLSSLEGKTCEQSCVSAACGAWERLDAERNMLVLQTGHQTRSTDGIVLSYTLFGNASICRQESRCLPARLWLLLHRFFWTLPQRAELSASIQQNCVTICFDSCAPLRKDEPTS